MVDLEMSSFSLEEKYVPSQYGNCLDLSLPPPCQFLTSLSVFGIAAALSAPTLLLPPHSGGSRTQHSREA